MKVTFLATHSLESPGGGGRFFPLAKALTQSGYDVTMITLHHDFARVQEKRFVQDGVHIWYVGQMHVLKADGRKTYFNPLKLLWVTAVATLGLTWAAWRTPADLIHICKAQPMNGLAAWVVHQVKRLPVYLTATIMKQLNNRFSGRWQQRLVAWFEDWIPSFASGITVNNSYIADRYTALGYPRDRIVLVPNSADRAQFGVLDAPNAPERVVALRQSLAIPPDHQVVVYVGSMSLVSHAIDLLLEAFALIWMQRPQTCLVLVGAGEDKDGLHQLAEQLGLATAVRFTDRVTAADVPFYYALGDVSVDPLRDTVAAVSSFSLKLTESLACGVPCVTTDVGDRKMAVGAAGTAVPPNDAPALAAAIRAVLDDPAAAARMRAAARQMRASLWWDVRARAFTSLYPTNHEAGLDAG
ncbi:MAG: glycosyltransferase family 4 protein [Anaerolineae bacterium]|nr:glycosyltransferase family 4 protein [Anaerolineae bacterium]